MKKLIFLLFIFAYSHGITPFSLEGIKELNVKFLNKNEKIPKALEKKIVKEVEEKLQKLGIKTNSDKYSYLKISLKIDEFDKTKFVRVTMTIQEDVKLLRENIFESMAITYQKNDEFEAEDLQKDVYESVIKYLLVDFIEQYKQEN